MFNIRKRQVGNARLCSKKNVRGFCDVFTIITLCFTIPAILSFMLAYTNQEGFSEYKNVLLWSMHITLLILMGKLVCNMYTSVYVVTVDKCAQTDHSIDELIAEQISRNHAETMSLHYYRVIDSIQKDMQASTKEERTYDIPQTKQEDMPTQEIVAPGNYDVPPKPRPVLVPELTPEGIKNYNAMRAELENFITLKNSKLRRRSGSVSSIDSGITKTSYITRETVVSDNASGEDPLEKIGPSTSGLMKVTWADEKSISDNSEILLAEILTSPHTSSSSSIETVKDLELSSTF